MSNASVTLLDEVEYAEAMSTATLGADRDACDWPELRRAVLAGGGIGPSRDWSRDAYPADLYRAHGKAPDLVAVETFLGSADVPPWGDAGSDSEMFAYLQRSWTQWQRVAVRERDNVKHRAPVVVAPVKRAPGTRSYAELVAELKRKHGDAVDLGGLRPEYVHAYETGERVTVEREGREYRGTIGATRGPRPRFVLLLSLDL